MRGVEDCSENTNGNTHWMWIIRRNLKMTRGPRHCEGESEDCQVAEQLQSPPGSCSDYEDVHSRWRLSSSWCCSVLLYHRAHYDFQSPGLCSDYKDVPIQMMMYLHHRAHCHFYWKLICFVTWNTSHGMSDIDALGLSRSLSLFWDGDNPKPCV